MKLDELKHSLGALTINDLEELGVIEEDTWNDEVLMLTTSEANDEAHNESTWVAAVNTEDTQLMIITNGMLTGQEKPEVGRVYVNEEKAEMLLEALRHAFPEILKEYTVSPRSKLRKKRYSCDSKLLSIASLEGAKTIAEAIKILQYTIKELRSLRKKNYEFESKVVHSTVSVKPKALSDNKKIDVHQALKKQLSSKFGDDVLITTIPGSKKTTYIATENNSKKMYLVQVDISDLAADNSLRDAKVIEITEDIGSVLLNQLPSTFNETIHAE